VTNHAPRNPRIKPVNGLDRANQSGIASRNWSGARFRTRQRGSAIGRSVERSEESLGINPFKDLSVFMLSTLLSDEIATIARWCDFLVPR
jgi:hypothetical protein